jgi:hypothetical protein
LIFYQFFAEADPLTKVLLQNLNSALAALRMQSPNLNPQVLKQHLDADNLKYLEEQVLEKSKVKTYSPTMY